MRQVLGKLFFFIGAVISFRKVRYWYTNPSIFDVTELRVLVCWWQSNSPCYGKDSGLRVRLPFADAHVLFLCLNIDSQSNSTWEYVHTWSGNISWGINGDTKWSRSTAKSQTPFGFRSPKDAEKPSCPGNRAIVSMSNWFSRLRFPTALRRNSIWSSFFFLEAAAELRFRSFLRKSKN
jgi:hypothetical protein